MSGVIAMIFDFIGMGGENLMFIGAIGDSITIKGGDGRTPGTIGKVGDALHVGEREEYKAMPGIIGKTGNALSIIKGPLTFIGKISDVVYMEGGPKSGIIGKIGHALLSGGGLLAFIGKIGDTVNIGGDNEDKRKEEHKEGRDGEEKKEEHDSDSD